MSIKCPACSTTYDDELNFCPKDGTRLKAGLPTPISVPVVGPPTPRHTAARSVPDSAAPSPVLSYTDMNGLVLDGRYKVLKKIGEGGMSFVYLAQDVSTKERYAIKVLSPSLSQDDNAMARLRREAGLGIRLAHPNVCHIMRLGETEAGLVYVVMPYVEGEILADRTQRLGHIPLNLTVKWVREMCYGLHAAHELKIIHRDLKPENIMICKRSDGVEYAVVMDFGLAKERKSSVELQKLTATGIILGTPEFMSPEQLRGKPLDLRTDIYSLALMTFEMLTGKLPFEGRSQQELMIARLRAEPIPLRKMRPELNYTPLVEKVLMKAMSREVDARYKTAPEFADALAIAAEGKDPEVKAGVLGKLFSR